MRGVVIALLALLQFSSVAFASETIVAGDSDHTYLPVWNEREVLLHSFSNRPLQSPVSYSMWGSAYTANCMPQYAQQSDLGMNATNKECTLAANRFQAPKMFRLTRVVYRTSQLGSASTSPWAQADIRVVTVSASGTLVEIGAEQSLNTGSGSLNLFNLAVDVPTNLGVGIQLKVATGATVVYENLNTFPTVELWGIWK